jgi:O-glycosyl hydrolase
MRPAFLPCPFCLLIAGFITLQWLAVTPVNAAAASIDASTIQQTIRGFGGATGLAFVEGYDEL